jgi:ribulose 1,5-bisphosphate synthetase/thiazole synthase
MNEAVAPWPIFSGMLLSGVKVASLIARQLESPGNA